MNSVHDTIVQLLQKVPRSPGSEIPGPAATQELEAFQASLGHEIPVELRDWLNTSNGPCVGPGGVFGVGAVPKHLSIEHYLSLYPEWRRRLWLPIAGDGCGNYFLLVATEEYGGGHPVVFVEPMTDPARPSYVVASNLWAFLDFLLRKEMAQSNWPFDETEVRAHDPAILKVVGVPLPWFA